MKFDVDLATGTVQAEFSLDEAQEILAALKAVRGGKAQVPVPEPVQAIWKLDVESFRTRGKSYRTAIWFTPDGAKHWSCQCPDNTFRKNFCKHLVVSDGLRAMTAAQL